MRQFLRHHIEAAREEPVERLLKPGIKATVIVAILTVAAHFASERTSYDRTALARLAAGSPSAKATATTGRRP
jgi:hypothetical protein